jgi:hypothetical protein
VAEHRTAFGEKEMLVATAFVDMQALSEADGRPGERIFAVSAMKMTPANPMAVARAGFATRLR